MTPRRHFLEPLLERNPGPMGLRVEERDLLVARRIEPAFDSQARRRGLLGRDSLPEGTALIIAPCNAVHTFFMRFAIDLIFADRQGQVMKVRQNLRPWRVSGALRAFAVIELPAGSIARSGVRRGDRLTVGGL